MLGDRLTASSIRSVPGAVDNEGAAAAHRIAIITSTYPFGRGEEFLSAELNALAELGCELTVFPAAPRSEKISHEELTFGVVRFSLLAPSTLWRALPRLRRNPRGAFRSMMMILQSRNSFMTKLKNLALFPTGLAVADEVCVRGLSHIHAHWLTGPSTVALIASQVAGVGWSYTAHSGDIFLWDNLRVEKTKSAHFGRVISEFGRQGLLRQSNAAAARPLEVIHLGVAVSNHDAVVRAQAVPGRIRLLCPAQLYSFKGHSYLLEALRKVVDAGVDFHCVFAGDGPLRARLVRQRKALGLETVVSMPGMIPHETLMQQMHSGAYDAVVMASVDLEGIPVALMEAMAAGIPCVASRIGGVEELIDAGCGILVKERDPQGMSQAIVALASDPLRRKEMGEQARQRVVQAFDAAASARALLKLIANALR
jgi:glycosyltransferase involved in cell wall biosynthesis